MKRNKYNIGTSIKSKGERTVDGILFMSKREAEKYKELKQLERTKKIKDLLLQPRFLLQDKFIDNQGFKHRKIEYVADFQYKINGKIFVEDSKGMKTDVYKIKKKLLLFKYKDFIFIES